MRKRHYLDLLGAKDELRARSLFDRFPTPENENKLWEIRLKRAIKIGFKTALLNEPSQAQ